MTSPDVAPVFSAVDSQSSRVRFVDTQIETQSPDAVARKTQPSPPNTVLCLAVPASTVAPPSASAARDASTMEHTPSPVESPAGAAFSGSGVSPAGAAGAAPVVSGRVTAVEPPHAPT